MEITVTTDDKELQASLRRLSVVMRKDLPEITKQSARRVCIHMARATAPFGFDEGARQSVVKNINSDISRVFRPIAAVSKELEIEDRRRLAFLVANRGPGVVTKFLKSIGVDMEYRKTAPKTLHNQKRNRNGRVGKGEKAGYAVPSESRRKLVDTAIKRVGLAKHGWAQCAKLLGGSRGINAKWVTNSKGKPGAGTVSEQRTGQGVIFTMTNHVPYVSRMLSATGIRQSMNRELDFLKQEYSRRVTKNW